jgi:uncharacterized protein
MRNLHHPQISEKKASERQVVQFIIKTSKFCNLRCSYCYEFEDLGNRQTISLFNLKLMYAHISDYYYSLNMPITIQFVWHGGEPLLLSPSFYWQTFADQKMWFLDDKILVENLVQTNLTVLNKPVLELLREGFDGVGVSIDLFGDSRVNSVGQPSQNLVIQNLDRLRDADIKFGCIAVLTKANISRINQIFAFFKKAGISFRVLPIFQAGDVFQNEDLALSDHEILDAFIELFELWQNSERSVIVEPIFTYTNNIVAAALPTMHKYYYDKSVWESIYIVNTDGSLYSYSDIYEQNLSHGNIFECSLSQLVKSTEHQNAIDAAKSRMNSVCVSCRHYGYACSGYPVAEESKSYGRVSPSGDVSCIKEKELIGYIEKRLYEMNVINPITRVVNFPSQYQLRAERSRSPVL